MKLQKRANKGFSLVELSIVLIIIGLLIAAVISGKALINSAKLAVIKSELETIKIATRNYTDTYDISDYTAAATADKLKNEKISMYHLSNSGYLEGSLTADDNVEAGLTSKVTGNAWYYVGDSSVMAFDLASASSKTTPALDYAICSQFAGKYSEAGTMEIYCATTTSKLKGLMQQTCDTGDTDCDTTSENLSSGTSVIMRVVIRDILQ